jgi:hypothetical protein
MPAQIAEARTRGIPITSPNYASILNRSFA